MINELDINSIVRKTSCSNSPATGCKACQRLPGIPIFPIRYTTCRIDDNTSIPSIPDDIKNSLTPISLDSYMDKDGSLKKGEPLNKYILRKLRKGYLYIYDEIYNGQWQCFGIYSTGELIPFAINTPPSLKDLNDFYCNSNTDNIERNFFTVPFGKERYIYIAYVEYPWSAEHVDKLTEDASLRKQAMQPFLIGPKIKSCIDKNKSVFKLNTLIPYLVEATLPSTIPYLNKVINIAEDKTQLSTVNTSRIYEAANKINKQKIASLLIDPYGLSVIIEDEIDIIEQLQASKNGLYNHFKEKVIERGGEDGLRDLCWLQAVQQLEHGIKASFNNKIKDIKNNIPPENVKIYQQENLKTIAKLEIEAYHLDTTKIKQYNGFPIEELEGYEDTKNWDYRATDVQQKNYEIINLSQQSYDALAQYKRYYHQSKRKELENYFSPLFEKVEIDKVQLDADYCFWLKHGLIKALERHDQTNIQYSMGAVDIISRLLDDGTIISKNSEDLWSWLFEDSQNNGASILIRGCLLNNYDLFNQYSIECQQTPLWNIDILKAKHWYDIIKKGQKLYEKKADIFKKEFVSPIKGWQAGWDDFKKPYRLLQKASTTARIALWNKNYAQAYSVAIKPTMSEIELALANRTLLLAGVIDAGMENDPFTQHLFGMKKSVIRADVLYEIIEKNAKLARRAVPNAVKEAFHPSAYKTSTSEGNFPTSKITDKNLVYFWTVTDFPVAIPSREKLEKAEVKATEIADRITQEEIEAAEQEIIKEQEKVANSLTAGKIYVTAGNLLMSSYSLLNAVSDLSHNPSSIEKLWKTLGSFVGLCQSYNDAMSNYYAYQSNRTIAKEEKNILAKTATHYKFASNFLSKAVAIIGIIDGTTAIIKAYNKYLHGGDSHDMKVEMTMGALTIAGAVLTIAIGGAVFLPVMLVLGVIFFGLCNSLVHLIPANIENWLRRSIYGKDQKYVMGKVFKNFEDEQASLNMVMEGITIFAGIERGLYIIEEDNPRYKNLRPLIGLSFAPSVPPDPCFYVVTKITYPSELQENINIKIENTKSLKTYLIGTIDVKNSTFIKGYMLPSPLDLSEKNTKTLSMSSDKSSSLFSAISINYLLNSEEHINSFNKVTVTISTEDESSYDKFYIEV